MGETKRKRGGKAKTTTYEETLPEDYTASLNDVVELPATTEAADTSEPDSQGRHRGRPKKTKSQPVSAKRRSSRLAELNGDCTTAVEVPRIPKWDAVVKVAPSMDAVVKVFCVHTAEFFAAMAEEEAVQLQQQRVHRCWVEGADEFALRGASCTGQA